MNRLVQSVAVVGALFAGCVAARAQPTESAISPAEAFQRDGQRVTAQFRVLGHGISAEGDFEVYSEESWRNEGCLFVRFSLGFMKSLLRRQSLPEARISQIDKRELEKILLDQHENLGDALLGIEIRATGTVQVVNFKEGPRAIILVNELDQIEEVPPKPVLVLDASGHTAQVAGALFTPDGENLITISYDKTIRVWDVATGQPIDVPRIPIGEGTEGQLVAAAISPDGKTLAVGAFAREPWKEGVIHLVGLESRTLRTLRGHDSLISALAFSKDGSRLASGAHDSTARIWDVKTGESLQILEKHERSVYGVAFSPDGGRLATASGDHTVLIWDARTGAIEATLNGHEDRVSCLQWSPDGNTIATGSADESIRLWDADGTLRDLIEKPGQAITSVAFTPDSLQLLVTGYSIGATERDGLCELIDVRNGKTRRRLEGAANAVLHGALSPDGKLAATTGVNYHDIYIWEITDASFVARLAGQGRGVSCVGWSEDGQTVAWGHLADEDGEEELPLLSLGFHVADLEMGGVPDRSFPRDAPRLGPTTLEIDPDDDTIVGVWLRDEHQVDLIAPDGFEGYVTSAALFPDDLAVVGSQRALFLFDTKTGEALKKFRGHTGVVTDVAPSPDHRFFLTGSDDQTIRVWTLDRDEPLLSLFFAGSEWVAWTPEGYYAASPAGERLMGWHVNNGPGELARFLAASQFHDSLHRPDVIKRVLGTGSVALALKEADEARGDPGGRLGVKDVLPPFVAITAPDQPEVETPEARIEVRFVAKAIDKRHPITAVRLLVDGRPHPGADGLKRFDPPRLGEVRDAWSVPLLPGGNTIVVEAESAVSKGRSEPISVTRLGGRGFVADDPEPGDSGTSPPTLHVIAIGISEYFDKSLTLSYCDNDATAIAEAFRTHGRNLFKNVAVKTLRDKEATRLGILRELDAMRSALRPEDVGVFFFAGHGGKDRDGKFYLFPADVDIGGLLGTGISGTELTGALEGARKVVVMLDACHSGSVNVKTGTDTLVAGLIRENGIVVMCSSRGREVSRESAAVEHGYFSQAILEGISGKALRNERGEVAILQLNAYADLRVRELSKGAQTPVFGIPTNVSSFPITKP